MVIPGLGPAALPVPVAHHDRPPEGWEAELFDSEPATMWNEHWAGVELETAQRAAGQLINAFRVMRYFPTPP